MTHLRRVLPISAIGFLLWAGCAPSTSAQLPAPVRAYDLAAHSPAEFRDDELYLPYYLVHFARFANSVRMEGPDRGFIDISVWRNEVDNRPYNARIMENLLSLAFFYATDRPWNPYHGDPAVRARLEAGLDFWVRMQSPEGRFSEYGAGQWNLAATAFATKFMGETLRLLYDGPPVDPALLTRVAAADRKAAVAVLTLPDLYEHGRSFSNQYSNAFAGALAYLALFPDPALQTLLTRQIERTNRDHQSPVGYFYEADGADWGYNLNTHHSNLEMAWSYARGTPIGENLISETERWYDWFSYNAVPEPDGSGFTMNRGIETRQQAPFVSASGPGESGFSFAPAERVELARVLGPTKESLARDRASERAELVRRWPTVDSLPVGTFRAFSPYAFLHRAQLAWYPTDAQRSAAMGRLPYIARTSFTHQRADTRKPVAFTYVRRPAYYAAFNSGELWREQQRYGLGLLWTPEAGALLQSQTAAADAAWGTRAGGTTQVYEARSFTPTFRVAGKEITLRTGNRDLPAGDLTIAYPLGSYGTKTLVFGDSAIEVTVEHSDPFVEQIPLLVLPTDAVEQAPGRITLTRGTSRMVLAYPAERGATLTETQSRVGKKRVVSVFIPASTSLHYTLSFDTR
jgi:hypothetical protein